MPYILYILLGVFATMFFNNRYANGESNMPPPASAYEYTLLSNRFDALDKELKKLNECSCHREWINNDNGE